MHRTVALPLALFAALLLPSVAAGKGLIGAEACGADGCTEIAVAEFTGSLYATGRPARAEVPPAPHFRFVLHIGVRGREEEGTSAFLWVPSQRRFGMEGRPGGPPNWFTVDRRQARDLNGWAAGQPPLPAGRYVVAPPDPFVGDRTPPLPAPAASDGTDASPALLGGVLAATALAGAGVVLRRRRAVPRP